MTSYNRLDRLQQRRIDPQMQIKALNEVYQRIDDEPAIRYAVGAMQPIDPEYTANTYKESERVQNQLTKPLADKGIEVEYEHQGSVTNDTHIKAHSDIDTLVIHQGFFSVEPPRQPSSPYQGDPIADLRSLRNHSTSIVKSKFPEVSVDTTGSKCVSLSGGSLRRKIDLVFCNWWDTVGYYTYNLPYMRGIRVLDNTRGERIDNKPFLHNERINSRDGEMYGNLRKLVRLLKSLIYDSDVKDALSSYDIASVIYNMPVPAASYSSGQELQLIQSCSSYLRSLVADTQARLTMEVPNGTRKVFCIDGANLNQLLVTIRLLDELIAEINQGLTRSLRKLSEARIEYK